MSCDHGHMPLHCSRNKRNDRNKNKNLEFKYTIILAMVLTTDLVFKTK